ncbi:MAG: hypothetical protein KC425_22465, partial [Anaerolineales bacterium]|nr:hypothetical protein [Anaerolineales bacterium]
ECPNGDCLANVMPRDYAERLTPEQIDAIVDYLLTGVRPAPTPAPIGAGAAQSTPKSIPAAKTAAPDTAERLPGITIQLLLVTLVLLLTLFRLSKE